MHLAGNSYNGSIVLGVAARDADTGRRVAFRLADLESVRPLSELSVRAIGQVTEGISDDGEHKGL